MLVLPCPKCGRMELIETRFITGEWGFACRECNFTDEPPIYKMLEPILEHIVALEDASAAFALREPGSPKEGRDLVEARTTLIKQIFCLLKGI